MSKIPEESYNSETQHSAYHEFVTNVLYSERVASFGDTWPHSKASDLCTPHNLAMAGLVFVSKSQAKCFVCGITLGDLQANSDPWLLHKALSPNCTLIQLGYPKQPDAYTMAETYMLLQTAMSNHMDEEFREFDTEVRTLLEGLNETNTFRKHSGSSLEF